MKNLFMYLVWKEKWPEVKIYMNTGTVMTDLVYWLKHRKSGRFCIVSGERAWEWEYRKKYHKV